VNPDHLLKKRSVYDVDFQDIRGQYQARRAMEVAVAGGHNIMMLYAVLYFDLFVFQIGSLHDRKNEKGRPVKRPFCIG